MKLLSPNDSRILNNSKPLIIGTSDRILKGYHTKYFALWHKKLNQLIFSRVNFKKKQAKNVYLKSFWLLCIATKKILSVNMGYILFFSEAWVLVASSLSNLRKLLIRLEEQRILSCIFEYLYPNKHWSVLPKEALYKQNGLRKV